jgi:hypothetical protein
MCYGVMCYTSLVGSLVPIFANWSAVDDASHHEIDMLQRFLATRAIPAGMLWNIL